MPPDPMPTLPPSPSAEGAPRDRLRLFHNGFVYSSAGHAIKACRYSATLLVALGEAEIEVAVDGGPLRRCAAAAFRPFVAREHPAAQVPYICIDLSPNHPRYRLFNGIAGDGVLTLTREQLAPLRHTLEAFHGGQLGYTGTRELMWRAADLVAALVPAPGALDVRVQRVMALLEDDPTCPLEQLAVAACLSRDRLTHLFSESLGIPLRRYMQTMKIHAAARFFGSGLSLTEIAAAAGFADSAHFSKVWTQCFGASPARYFSSEAVALYPLPRAVRETVLRHPERRLRDMLPATAFASPQPA